MEKMNDYFHPLEKPFDLLSKGQEVTNNKTHLWGFGFDGTACFRKGTVAGPDAIREVSFGIESYSPYLDLDIEDLADHISDLGNVKMGESGDVTEDYLVASNRLSECIAQTDLKKNSRFLLMGGEHSISYGQIKAYLEQFDDLVLLHLDAHADLRDGYEGYHYSHASIIKRCLDHFGPGHELLQYGIRSGTKQEYEWMNEQKTLLKSRNELLEKIASLPNDRPIYLTLDLDFFDPSFFPGTGTPEPGGEDFPCFVSLMKMLKEKKFVGADVVELAPNIDPTGNSSVFAAKVVREILIALTWKLKERK